MKKKVRFSDWGHNGLPISNYAYRYEHERPIDAIVRSLERTTRLCVVTCKPGHEDHFGRYYDITLAKRAHGGGYEPVAQIGVRCE